MPRGRPEAAPALGTGGAVTGRRLRKAAHILLFVLAGALFYAGLGVGLQHDPNLGTLLWAASAAIFVLNALWMRRSGG